MSTRDYIELPPDEATRAPAWSQEAEQSVLGGLMLDNRAWDRVGDLLQGRHFFAQSHGFIFEAIGSLVNALKPADVVTVYERLKERGRGDEVGGMAYLNALVSSVPSAANARRYAEIVHERHAERMLLKTAEEAVVLAQGRGTPMAKLDAIVTRFGQLERERAGAMPVGLDTILVERIDHLNDLNERGDEPSGWSTRLPSLDRILLGGLQAGRIYLLAGRPSMGKSALAQWWALNGAVHHELVVLYLSLEMPNAEVGDRSIAMVGKVSYAHVQTGKLDREEWGRVSLAVETGAKAQFHVDDQAGLTIGEIRIKARFVKGLKLLVVDYVQLCKGAEEGEVNRNSELEIISRGLKELAKELGCAVVVLSQLARRVEERPHKRALMSDLKDCGGLEQDADAIFSLFPIKDMPHHGYALVGLDVLKNKQGQRGTSVVLEFHGERLGWAESQYTLADLLAKPAASAKEL